MKGPKWTNARKEPGMAEQILERLRFGPKTRAELKDFFYANDRCIGFHTNRLVNAGLVAGGQYVRGQGPAPLYLTERGKLHQGPVIAPRWNSSVKAPEKRTEEGGIVACAMRRPSFVFHLGGV